MRSISRQSLRAWWSSEYGSSDTPAHSRVRVSGRQYGSDVDHRASHFSNEILTDDLTMTVCLRPTALSSLILLGDIPEHWASGRPRARLGAITGAM
jgi:hypothetical protein